MKDLWLSKERVVELTGFTPKWVELQVAAGKMHARETDKRGRNGKPVKEYSAASLPQDARAKLAREESPSPKSQAQGTAIALAPLFAGHPLQTGARVALVDPRDQQKASQRLAIIQPILDYRSAAPGSYERNKYLPLRVADGRAVTTVELLEQYLSEMHGVSARSIRRWAACYRKHGGDVALADKRRADKNQSRWAKHHPELAQVAAHVLLQRKLSVTVAFESVCLLAQQRRLPIPSYETVRSFLNNIHEIDPGMKTYALEGKQKYEAVFAPYIRRGYTDVASNELWVSDHAIADTLVQDDIFQCDLRHMRLQMTTLLDFHSRYVVGYTFSEAGSSRSIISAFRRAASQYGLPYGFYCDNGKDYRKVAKGAQRHELEQAELDAADRIKADLPSLLGSEQNGGVLARLGIPVTYCIPFHPQSKHVERYHRTWHERFCKIFDTYTGGAPHLRPDRTTAELSYHNKLRMMRKRGVLDAQGVMENSALPLASEYIALFEAWLEKWYHARPQRGEGMDGRSPSEVFAQDQWNVRKPIQPEQLDLLLLERAERVVDAGTITLNKRRYMPPVDDLPANILMQKYTTSKVIVCYDPCDPEQVTVLDQDGHLLCRMQAEVLVRQSGDPETRAQIAASMGLRHALARGVRDSLSNLDRSVVQMGGYKSQAESLREIAQLPAAVGDHITHRPATITPRTVTVPQPLYTYDIAKLLED